MHAFSRLQNGILIWVLVAFSVFLFLAPVARGTQYTLTIVTNSPGQGTVTGGGTYASGTIVPVNIQANYGWYVSDVAIDPPIQKLLEFQKIIILGAVDPTTITNDSESILLTNNCTLTVAFQALAPTFTESPLDQTLITGEDLTLNGQVAGRAPFNFQWQKNGQSLANQTNSTLAITNAEPSDSGSYTLIASNAFGTNVSLPASVFVRDVLVSANGVTVTNSSVSGIGPTLFDIYSRFPTGMIFYTLDGSTPDFNGYPYFGSFYIEENATLRVVAYSPDFFEVDYSDPILVNIQPFYSLTANTPGGGFVAFNPYPVFGSSYPSNTTVTLTALPVSGFTFMNWSGMVSGTNPVTTVTMNQDVTVQANFGAALKTTAAGGGVVTVAPAAAIYPYGSTVKISAIPDHGSYFGIWGNSAFGRTNPLYFSITTGAPEVSALFAPVPSGQTAITVLSDGGGAVSVSPNTNKCKIGATVVLTAIPNPGSQFLGWSGDATGNTNPLSVIMSVSKVITAEFSRSPVLSISPAGNSVHLHVTGAAGDVYQIQASTDRGAWLPLTNLPNFFGTVSFTDPKTPAGCRMYRAVANPTP